MADKNEPVQLQLSTLGKWIPYKLAGSNYETFCEWLYTGEKAFNELVSGTTINNFKALPENNVFQKNITSLSRMLDWARKAEVTEPAAFIFHVSRCGSTMVARMLAACEENTVFSEVPFFDDILRILHVQKYEDGNLLKEVIKLYSLPKNSTAKKVFIKTDSWHIMYYAEIRKMFPQVPFILLYRNPAEVVRSQNKSAGMHCIPQVIPPAFFGIQEEIITAEDFYNYPIKVTEKYLQAFTAIAAKDKNAYLFNYNQGMVNIVEQIGKIANVIFTEDEWQRMKELLQYHSKLPGMVFSPEPAIEINEEKFSKAFALYNQLEGLRTIR